MLIISAAGDYSLRCSSFSSDLARLEGKRLRVQTRGDLGRVYASSQGLRSFVPGLAEGKVDKKKKEQIAPLLRHGTSGRLLPGL